MQLYQLFPIPIGKFQYDNITQKELDFIKKLEYKDNLGNQISVNKDVLESRELKKIKKFIESSVREYFNFTSCPNKELDIYVHLSWTNITNNGQFHHKHRHPNSFLSGVFYLQTLDDRIYFHREGYSMLSVPPTEFNMYNSITWWYPAETGTLLIFPSDLTHHVQKVTHDTPRISLSFNTWLRGPVGDKNDASYVYCN